MTVTAKEGSDYSGEASATFTIKKADITMTTAPAAVADLVYSGNPQTLITAGVASFGTVLYSLDGTLTLNFDNAASIVAGKPYLVKVTANADLSTAPFTGAIVSKTAVPFTSTVVDFVPTLGKTLITGPEGKEDDEEAVLFLTSGNKLVNPTVVNDADEESSYMKGFRAYFLLKGEAALARSFRMDFGDGETTGIIAIGTDRTASTDNATYMLDGRRISKATKKGVYIRKGKKVIIRSEAQGDAFQSKK